MQTVDCIKTSVCKEFVFIYTQPWPCICKAPRWKNDSHASDLHICVSDVNVGLTIQNVYVEGIFESLYSMLMNIAQHNWRFINNARFWTSDGLPIHSRGILRTLRMLPGEQFNTFQNTFPLNKPLDCTSSYNSSSQAAQTSSYAWFTQTWRQTLIYIMPFQRSKEDWCVCCNAVGPGVWDVLMGPPSTGEWFQPTIKSTVLLDHLPAHPG